MSSPCFQGGLCYFCGASWLVSLQESPVSIAHIAIEVLRLQMPTIASGFTGGLRGLT